MAVIPATLNNIKTKVRRLTRSPSISQLTDPDLLDYINTFLVYDMPEHIRQFKLRQQYTFYANPFQDTYPTDIISFVGITTNPLYNFQNIFLTLHDPVYIAGFQSFFTQSREQFFGIYPNTNNIQSIGAIGDNVTTNFVGNVINVQGATLLQNQVLFDSVDANGGGLALVDVPLKNPLTGNNSVFGNLYEPNNLPTTPLIYPTDLLANNHIQYNTGAFNITFPRPPATGQAINSQTVPAVPAMPQSLLFYENEFTIRPVPDQPYRVNFEVDIRPIQLLQNGDSPQLDEWWQYIAYGAAKKIFEDRMDIDSVQNILPEYKKQEALCLRRTIVQYTNERTATIYTEQTSFGPGSGAWGWGGGPF